MKNKIFTATLFLALFLAACTPAAPAVATALATIVPSPAPHTQSGLVIEPYLDVRDQNISNLNQSLDEALIQTLWFNEATIWSRQDREIARNVLQLGMNPGLGVRDLHAEGITGEGINVAIIDQNLLLDHPEFSGKIVKYQDVGTEQPADRGSMHGPAVTSLLVGETIGTAPGAHVYYAAAPSWHLDARYDADALHWIIEENQKLPQEEKIRVVSVSAAPSGEGSQYTHTEAWEAAYQEAMEAGILVIDCTHEHRVTAPCYYDLHDPDNPATCIPGWPQAGYYEPDETLIHVPAPRRTTAEEYEKGKFSYQYDGQGGLSWTVPYLAGVLAMGWQINPHLTASQLLDLVYESAYVTDTNMKIIDPRAFIESVRLTVNH